MGTLREKLADLFWVAREEGPTEIKGEFSDADDVLYLLKQNVVTLISTSPYIRLEYLSKEPVDLSKGTLIFIPEEGK